MAETPEELAKRLKALEEEAARLRAAMETAQQQSSEPAANETTSPDTSSAEEPTQTPQSEPQREDSELETREYTEQEIRESELLVRRAVVELNRGNIQFAERYLAEAQAITPNTSLILETKGDIVAAAGKRLEAIEFYKKAMKVDPKNLSAERKHANAVFATQASSITLSTIVPEPVASRKWAVISTFMVPGSGQIITGAYAKGAGFLIAWLIGIITLGLNMEAVSRFARGDLSLLGGPVGIGAGLMMLSWFFAIIDIQAARKHYESLNKLEKIVPPKPPVDLPY